MIGTKYWGRLLLSEPGLYSSEENRKWDNTVLNEITWREDIKSEDLSRGGLNNSTNSITSFTYY